MPDDLSSILESPEHTLLANGLGATEGPLWHPGGYLTLVDLGGRLLKWDPGSGISVIRDNTGEGNGCTFDREGNLIMCEGEHRSVTRTNSDGTITTIADRYQGKLLNRPNDVVSRSDGSIYFTDPWTSPLTQEQWDLTYAGVFRVTPDLGTITLLVEDFILPNGLMFSPDESVLYVNDSRRSHIRAFDMNPNGTLSRQSDRVFADLSGNAPGVPDGMKVDVEGNVYCGGSGGIHVLDPSGKKLGLIEHGAPSTTNLAFGGDDWKTLYFTTWNYLGSVQLNIAGSPGPGVNRG